jgi:hypothetical protein
MTVSTSAQEFVQVKELAGVGICHGAEVFSYHIGYHGAV